MQSGYLFPPYSPIRLVGPRQKVTPLSRLDFLSFQSTVVPLPHFFWPRDGEPWGSVITCDVPPTRTFANNPFVPKPSSNYPNLYVILFPVGALTNVVIHYLC